MSTTLFDFTQPLPRGTTVLEASAGTGKTFAIAALAARFVAEGAACIDELLLITFSRAATAELRLRVRERFITTADDLAAALEGATPDDPVSAFLAAADPDEVARRTQRLRTASGSFDKAAIMTTHEFCHGMLAGLGVLASQTPQSTLVEDLTPLALEAAEDVFIRMFAGEPHGAPFAFSKQWDSDPGAVDIARESVAEVAELVGHGSPGQAGARVEFGLQVRSEVERRKDARRLYSFDDQLTRLDRALADPAMGEHAQARLAGRFPVVLVDEFQDTDPTQWSVLSRAFAGASTLVLIGDPKQAIYGFRGGDVHTYARAVQAATARTTLGVNHRSDPEVVAGVGQLFAGVELGEDIIAPPVSTRHESRLAGAPGTAWERGVQVRTFENEVAVPAFQATRWIQADLVGVVSQVLSTQAPLRVIDGNRTLDPREIAVLVRSNKRGQQIAGALTRAGIPATFTGSNSVFGTEAAGDWVTLLQALDQLRRPYVQRAWLTDFVGATVTELALADDARRETWWLHLNTWARVLARSGVPALMTAFDADTDFTARLLRRPDGERLVADHRHLAELLHRHHRLVPAARARALAAWVKSAGEGPLGAEGTRRRDTDADAVQVMTIHRAKGLQWSVVLLPEVAHARDTTRDTGAKIVLPAGEKRVLDIGGRRSPGREDRWARGLIEEGDEAIRALYVGLTRAESRVVTWWAHHVDADAAPLHRLLHATHDSLAPQRPEPVYPTKSLVAGGSPRHLGWLAGGDVAVVPAERDPDLAVRPASEPGVLEVRPWLRTVDHSWRRTSYSGLTAQAHEFAAPLDGPMMGDEPVDQPEVDADPRWQLPSPMAGLPAGAAFGTLVHAIYEHTDATGPDWGAALAVATADALRRWPLSGVAAHDLATALEPSFDTPLGPLAPRAILRDFSSADRLAELNFEFALDNPAATLADIANLLTSHLEPDDPLVDYPRRLDHPGLIDQTHFGFHTGSIDAVYRLDGHADAEGFLVVDYKTNRLAPPEEPLTLGHYSRAAMAEAMMASHYPLQALLYAVALHRFLRLRLPDYDPDRHLAGVAYLFVRGMGGPDVPTDDGHPLGVFSWRPPTAMVLAVSRLLAGGDR